MVSYCTETVLVEKVGPKLEKIEGVDVWVTGRFLVCNLLYLSCYTEAYGL